MTQSFNKQLELAKYHFEEGWSLSVAMAKAGFRSNWKQIGYIRNNPDVQKLVELRDIRIKQIFNLKKYALTK